jgi:ABC-type iron transport system FetAB ATPase subunit
LCQFWAPSLPTVWAWKLLLFIGLEEGNLVFNGKNVSALDSTRVIQTVGSKCAPRTAKFADCPRCTIWTNKRSRSKPFLTRPDHSPG